MLGFTIIVGILLLVIGFFSCGIKNPIDMGLVFAVCPPA